MVARYMFVGHFAVGFAAKPAAPKTSLGTLFLAALLADVLWIAFAFIGLEHVAIKPGITAVNALDLVDIGFSHSLAMDTVWAALLAGIYFLLRRYRRGAWIVFALVLSHWLLDFVSHRPDMPLVPGGHHVFGLGLWNSRLATFLAEGGLWVAGIILFVRATRPVNRAGTYVFWIMAALLTALWLLSLNGAPPPSLAAVRMVNLILFTIVLAWAYWMERLRPATSSESGQTRAAQQNQ